MSYILEALKKAQAERQLGNAPTLHAPTLRAGTQAQQGVKKNTWLMVAALGAMAAALAVLAVLLWRPAALPASSPAASPSESPAAVLAAAPAALQPEPSMSAPEATPAPLPLPAPVAALPPPVATTTTITAPARAVSAPAALPAAAAPAATATSVEPVLNLRELPEPIQRSIPPVVVGGYIYSKNAADRLLLVDKILRREGEEVAPGLLLEKLNPKEAVFNFKGYRYRVPY